MDWVEIIGNVWMRTALWTGGFAAAFGILVKLMPCNPGMYWCNSLRAAVTDFMYWFVAPFITRIGTNWLFLLVAALVCGGKQIGFWPLKDLPVWQQCLAMLVIEDVILYAMHRLFHTPLGWRAHAIHHAPTDLDWTATARFHPINHVLEFGVADIVVLLMGFSLDALGTLIMYNMIYSAMVHANLNWTFGPLRYVLASPVFHRWHHTTEAAGMNKNFASTFPVLDLMCGTFYMPAGKLPEAFGTGAADFPQGFWAQMFYPFRISRPGRTETRAAAAPVRVLSVPAAPSRVSRRSARRRSTVRETAPVRTI